MDSIQNINPLKDTSLAIMLEAQARDWQIHYMQVNDLSFSDNKVIAKTRGISVRDDQVSWYALGEEKIEALNQLDVIFMRKDPPVDANYIYCTYLLDHLKAEGVLVCNDPQSLRDMNEKLAITYFPECTAPTLISSDVNQIRKFIEKEEAIVVKPLDGMGGRGIFKLSNSDPNINVTLEMMTENQATPIMAQKFIPESANGDKRILLIDGEPIPQTLLRVPKQGEFRGNLAKGATAEAGELTDHDKWICERLKSTLCDKGLLFTGIDILGDYLTEINITSPTCVRELDSIFSINVAKILLDKVEEKLKTKSL